MINSCTEYPRIAALMTCFNRKELTLRCLQTLNAIPEKVEVFLVNDNCTDGTPEAVQVHFPQVHIIQGTGTLYWNRGMHLAWSTALSGKYDFYLLLNDDVSLYSDFLTCLLADSKEKEDQAILSGAVKDPQTGNISYGGINRVTQKRAEPNGVLQPIQNLNGNVLLVPCSVVNKIGILDPVYKHHFGDGDYGLRAWKNGIEVLLGKKYAGECKCNPLDRNRKPGVTIWKRFQFLYSPFGSPPKSIVRFWGKHKSYFYAFIYVIYLHLINVIPDKLYFAFFPNRKELR